MHEHNAVELKPTDLVIRGLTEGCCNWSGRTGEAVEVLSGNGLCDRAIVGTPQIESGSYRGPIIGETEHHIIQRQSGRTGIAHPKDLLDRQPQIGESVRITYSDSKGAVREFRERAKSQDLSR